MFSRNLLVLITLALGAGGMRAQTSEPLFAPVPLAPAPMAEGALAVSEESARRTLALGFAATAAAQAERLVGMAAEGSPERDRAARLLAAARLELDDAAGARAALDRHSSSRPPEYHLRAGLIAAREGRVLAAQDELADMRADALPPDERAWFYFLQGLIAESGRDAGRAGAAYEQAFAVSTSEWQRARLRLARERLRLAQGEMTDQQAESLKQQAERYAGRVVGTDYAVQYAVALSLLGRAAGATAFLQNHLSALTASEQAGQRDDTRLMLGLIAGPSTSAGRSALEQLLTGGSDPVKQRMALTLLVEGAESAEGREQLRRLAARLLAATPPHALSEELWLARGELALRDRLYGEAEAAAREALARSPGSPLRARALTQLAETAWELRRFRSAADYASQAAGATGDAEAAAGLRLLAAEATYRAAADARRNDAPSEQDFTAAAAAYAKVAERPPSGMAVSSAWFQQTMSELGAGRLAAAATLIDGLSSDPRFDPTTRWQAEWNLARALQAAGQSDVALARLAKLAAEADAAKRPADLRARLAWLQARLAQDAGRAAQALELARAIPDALVGVESGLAREIAGLGRLVEAEALFGLGRPDEAVVALKALREQQAGTEAAMQSFLVEADYQAAAGRLVDAQGLLVGFADANRDHAYTPFAIYQAALNAERRGEDAYYREAYVLLERLVKDYKDHELVFAARMKQGDLLRRFGDFAAAQQTYEELLNRFSQRPEALAAQLALADCHRAQAARDVSHYESAVTILERLRDLANAPVDVRAEAGFKLGDLIAARDARGAKAAQDALAVWGPMADALVRDDKAASTLGARGRYWMGRMLVRMAGVLDQQGRPEESLEIYRLLVARGLPGAGLAEARLSPASGSSSPGGGAAPR